MPTLRPQRNKKNSNDMPLTASEITISRQQAVKLRKYLAGCRPVVKIGLIGSGGIGKRCIIHRFAYNEFSRHGHSLQDVPEKMIIGVQGYAVLVELSEVYIGSADTDQTGTGGLLEHGLAAFKWHDVCLLCYDGTRRETLERLQLFNENYVKPLGDHQKFVMVVVSRSDSAPNWEVDVSEGEALAGSIGVDFVQMSAMENVGTREVDLVKISSLALLHMSSLAELSLTKRGERSLLKRVLRWVQWRSFYGQGPS